VIIVGKGQHRLKEVCLEIIDICPLECVQCSGSCDLTSEEMLSLFEVKRIINEFADMNGRILEISGGEPLMHPNLFEIVRHAKMNQLETVLYTSGVTLDSDERMISIETDLADKFRRLGLDKVIFNLQGATSETHERITRKKGSFNRVVRSVEIIKSAGCWVGVHFVPMKPNYSKLRDVIHLCHDLGVNEIGFLQFVPQGRGLASRQSLELSKKEFKEFTQDVTELTYIHENPHLRVGRPADFRCLLDASITKQVCNAGVSRCLISPKGNVVPCPAFKWSTPAKANYIAGNVKADSLADIWQYSPTWRDFRQFDCTKMSEPCRSCEHLNWCQGGCKAQRISKYGKMYAAPDPHCFAASTRPKELVEQIC